MLSMVLKNMVQRVLAKGTARRINRRRSRNHHWQPELLETKTLLSTFYVDASNPTGGGDGTESDPYVNIGRAVAAASLASGDDVIQIAPGVYRENITINDSSGALTIQGVSGNRGEVVIDGGGVALNRNAFTVNPLNDITFKDLTITNAGRDGILQQGVYDPAILPLSTTMTVSNVSSTGNGFSGLAIVNAGSLIVNDSDLSNNGSATTGGGNGVYAVRANHVTINNINADRSFLNGIFANEVRSLDVKNAQLTNSVRGNGLNVRFSGAVSADNISTDFSGPNNNVNGVFINEVDTVSLSNVSASNNSFYGLGIFNIHQRAILSNVVANNNPRSGIRLNNAPSVIIRDSSFSRNASTLLYAGLELTQIASLNLSGIQSNDNFNEGMRLYLDGAVTIENSEFNRNASTGIRATSLETFAATDLEASDNAGSGLAIGFRSVASLLRINASNNIYQGVGVSSETNQSSLTISESLFANNFSSGAVVTNVGSVEIVGSELIGNGPGFGEDYEGSGLKFLNGQLLRIVDSVIRDNSSAWSGGGISAVNNIQTPMSVEIARSTVSGNSTTVDGGGVFVWHGTLNVSQSTFSDNHASAPAGSSFGSGGAIFGLDVVADLTNNTVSGNSATGNGGGVLLWGNSTGVSRLKHNTIALNAASNAGGGVFLGGGSTTLNDNLIALNAAGSNPDFRGSGVTSLGGNLIGNSGGVTGPFNSSDLVGVTAPINPGIGPLADNGGPTMTHALLPESPAINAGNTNLNVPPAATDQRGFARAGRTDIGAFENQAPVAVNDNAETNEDEAVIISVLANDSELDQESMALVSVSNASHGTATINADGTVTFSPEADFHGLASFTYVVTDAAGLSSAATAIINVIPVQDAPVATDDFVILDEDTLAQIGVLSNDDDVDGDVVTVEGILSPPTHGDVVVNSDGTITYIPAANFYGTDSFSYSVSDGNGGSDQATVFVTVNSVNDTPVAVSDSVTTTEDKAITVDVTSNDSDIDGDIVLVSAIVTPPAHGEVSITAEGKLLYTPDTDFSGSDTLVYEVSDGHGGTAMATLTITVFSQQTQLNSLRAKVQSLQDAGVISRSQGRTLLGYLKFSKNTSQTISSLTQFQRDVQQLISNGTLTSGIGNELIFDAENLKISVSTTASTGGGGGGGKGNGKGPNK